MSITNVTVKVEHVVRLDDLASIAMRTDIDWQAQLAEIYCCVPDCTWSVSIDNDSLFRLIRLAVEHNVTAHART